MCLPYGIFLPDSPALRRVNGNAETRPQPLMEVSEWNLYYVRRDCLRYRGKAHTNEKHFRLPTSFPAVRRGIVKEFDAAKMKAEIGIGLTLGAFAVE